MLPFLPKRPFHLGGVSSCLLQWECPNVSIQVNQWYVNSYFLQSYPFTYPFFIPKIFIDLLNLGVLFFIQDFFCRDVFYLLIISNLPIYLLSPGPGGQEVLLVTVPEFSHTQAACLVNLRTLSCEPVSFSAFSAKDDEESQMNISH